MLEARRQFQLSQLDLAFKLNEIESKKKIEFMERACGKNNNKEEREREADEKSL